MARADFADPADCARLFEEAGRLRGGLDILVANAGVQEYSAFTELSLEDWSKVIDVNLTISFSARMRRCADFGNRLVAMPLPHWAK